MFAQLFFFDLGCYLTTAFEFLYVGVQRCLEVGELTSQWVCLVVGGIFQIIQITPMPFAFVQPRVRA